ncbi:related to GYP1-cis-golgi GTPase-activating protein [Sporisorium reilianum f. sp. reilianum]|uniref:Related to GYP1-cis-golgi GTPase-activating protein n=1 Tax=Sporisorium reilianum f. sp. reilianum TaxID=72559 RepID=A0A2N8U856_9BASI|nr:related to GYP1-cis-golgi GTPase-activating protein [Sporisorium reilianum f. sp. reilianum]
MSSSSRDRSLLQLLDPNDLLPGHTTADLYSLRHLTLRGGLPDSPSWLRAQAWKVLLGYLPPEKKEWSSTLATRRREYYQFLNDLSPPSTSSESISSTSQLTTNDQLLDQIYKDLVRSRKNGFAFYQAPPRPSASCPVVPLPSDDASPPLPPVTPVQRLETRDNLLHRLAVISHEYAQQLSLERIASASSSSGSRRPPQILHVQTASDLAAHAAPTNVIDDPIKSPPILLSPPSPGGMSRQSSQHSFASANEAFESMSSSHDQHDDEQPSQTATIPGRPSQPSPSSLQDIPEQRNWHSLLRILYLFALLNPSIGYVQGMNEALFTLLYVFGSAQYPHRVDDAITPSSSQQAIVSNSDDPTFRPWDNAADLADLTTHAEADTFWCFSALIGEMRELYDFDRVEQQSRGDAAPADRHPSHAGMAGALRRFSLRIKWLDPPLWRDLQVASLDPRLPYYSLRWLACLLSTEHSLPSVLRIWDALLAEQETAGISGSAKIEFLIDVCASMILQIKDRLPNSNDDVDLASEGFSSGMRVLQEYPDDDISPVVEAATLIRQRRLAADLTGDGPPEDTDDDEDSNPTLAAVKAKAAQAWRDWTSPRQVAPPPPTQVAEPSDAAPPATKGGWLVSRARQRPSQTNTQDADLSIASSADETVFDASTPSKSTFSGFLAKYAEAVQSSDAAANFSKASTNLTAKAMARFADRTSRESTPEYAPSPQSNQAYGSLGRGFPHSPSGMPNGGQDSRFASLGSIGAGFFTRSKRNASESMPSPRTPDMARWSRETMPDFPLPNVADSPAGRMEYIDTFGKRISVAQNGRSLASPSSSIAADDSRERRGSENGLSNFPLPSMRAAARMGILPSRFREESASPSSRSAGPKPLLLSQSARPPREGSNSPGSLAVDEPSRKISSGPMGHSMSRGNSHQDATSSVAGSFSGRSSRSVSAADSRRSSIADFGDNSMPGLSQPDTLPPLPSLMGQSAAANLSGHSIPVNAASFDTHAASSRPLLQGSISKDGTVSAGAFARATTKPADADRERPEFGQVSSSSDVPLVQATSSSISRPRVSNRKRTSSSTVESRTASTSGSMTGTRVSNRSSQTTNIVDSFADQSVDGAQVVSEEPVSFNEAAKRSDGLQRDDSAAMGSWGADTSAPVDRDAAIDQVEAPSRPEVMRKYTLTDEPLPAPAGTDRSASSTIVRTKRVVKGRQNSNSSVATTSSRRSLAGLRQSSRTSVSDQPASPRLPEVEEHLTAHEAYANGSNGVPPSHDAVEDKLDLRTLRIAESTRSTSPLSIGRTSGARPSTDRSNFF